ncbi:putative inositol-3-phosphate synthase protein [Rosellinia necatrix]|uniref:Putative inositol-3-phosphate synthase protein n=1 Tax=Rosellinia necatrix TaxID=77044 RepID=A0A1W2TJ03_ROSNE|nr:putative inositol-3-phosphate synthase protein [Rosellinia necatrix]
MTYSMLVYLSRKPGTTPEHFKDYYNNKHMPLYRQLAGPHAPALHVQQYIDRAAGAGAGAGDGATPRNPSTPARVLLGGQADFDYDVVVTIDYADEAAFRAHYEFITRPDVAATIATDEERFLDRSQTRCVLLGERIVSGPGR